MPVQYELGWLMTLGVYASAGLGAGVAWASGQLAKERAVLPVPLIIAVEIGLVLWASAISRDGATLAVSILLSAALLTLAMVDIAVFRLPNVITLPLIGLGLAVSVAESTDLAAHIIGAAAGWAAVAGLALAFRRLRGRDGIGMGDAKLLAAAGAWLGWRVLPWTVLLACALGFAWVGLRALRHGQASLGASLPFGAPLALAIWIVRLYGAAI